jgi:outer membrane translocation and assembly module TamA
LIRKGKGKEKERGESAEAEVEREWMMLREERIALKGRIRALEGMLEAVKVHKAKLE